MKEISKEELYYTYRKVKRELFNNKDTVYFDRIIEFENDISNNINLLFELLNSNHSIPEIVKRINVGEKFYTLKKIKLSENLNKFNCSILKVNIDTLSKEIDYPYYVNNIDSIVFRSFGDLSIEFQIISALWLNRVGYVLEKKMSKNSYGNRLKDITGKKNYTENHSYHKPYFKEYKKWQENLIDKVSDSDSPEDILVITTDFKDFFPTINLLKLKSIIEKEITEDSKNLNELLFALIEKYNIEYNEEGLPLNLVSSSSLANTYLLNFDNWIEKQINPIYYGRYVDDILIALDLKTELASKIFNNDSDSLGKFRNQIQIVINDLELKLNTSKSKVFLLNKSDKNKFIQLKEHLNKTSSEWRLIPSTEKYDDSKLSLSELFSDNFSTSHFANLKETYNVSTKRNYFIKEILNFEKTYFIMDKVVWRNRLCTLLISLYDVIFDIDNFVVFQKHIPRVIGLLFQTNNEDLILKYLDRINRLLFFLEKSTVLKDELHSYIDYLKKKSIEFIFYFTPLSKTENKFFKISKVKKFFNLKESYDKKNQIYFNSDLHFELLFNTFYKYSEYQNYLIKTDLKKIPSNIIIIEEEKRFISDNLNSNSCCRNLTNLDVECDNCVEIYETIGFYFFTRRITILELSIAFKNKIIDDNEKEVFISLAKRFYSKYNNSVEFESKKITHHDGINNIVLKEITIRNSDESPRSKVVICNSHFLTKNDSFTDRLQSFPESDKSRVDRIINIVNNILRCGEKIDYVVFHELSIPRNLYIIIAQRLAFSGINLIAGLEYSIDKLKLTVDNQLLYVLKINNSYSEAIALYQSKIIPAIHEEKEIRNQRGYSMLANFPDKLLINHNEFVFSGMICNDLINVDNRCFLRGKIDFLFIVAWNTDVGTYEHLVKTTAFDTHSYTLLCNNRKYGDSHIFAPFTVNHKRYLQRINGGKIDNFMISEIDIVELRKFQINYISPDNPFKPLPTGFVMSKDRKKSLIKLLKV